MVRDVVKRYGAHTALNELSMQARAGEILGIAGPNGAGKSTLARLLLGFGEPDAGSITIDGTNARRFRQQEGVGYLPEEAVAPWACTVEQFLALDEIGRATRDPIEILGIAPLLSQSLSTLSKGQWRTTLICHAFLRASGLIVLDEPDSGLDPAALDRLGNCIRHAAARGSTVLVLSHNLDELQRVSDRMVFIFAGRIAADRTRSDLTELDARDTYRQLVHD